MPEISIIIPYFSKENTISRAVQSVIAQTFNGWELVIVDDCSPLPLLLLPEWKDYNIRLVRNEKNIGPGPTRQLGMSLCSGSFLAFLDADDWWSPEFLEKSMNLHMQYNNILSTWCVSKIYTDSDADGHIRRYNEINHIDLVDTLLKYGHSIQTSAFLWRRKFCGEWGKLTTNQDSWFEYSSCLMNRSVRKVDEILLFRDETGDEHRKKYVDNLKQKKNTFELYIFVKNTHKSLNINNKILLFNRIIISFIKLKQINYEIENESKFKLAYPIFSIFFGSSVITLKIIHRFLQQTPFKIYF